MNKSIVAILESLKEKHPSVVPIRLYTELHEDIYEIYFEFEYDNPDRVSEFSNGKTLASVHIDVNLRDLLVDKLSQSIINYQPIVFMELDSK